MIWLSNVWIAKIGRIKRLSLFYLVRMIRLMENSLLPIPL